MDARETLTPKVALVGRTNVGKSTLFNRLLEEKKALMSPIAGTTHDVKFGHCHWQRSIFTVIDTAGLDLTSAAASPAALKKQAEMAMKKADLVLLLVDVKAGVMPEDKAFAKYLQKRGRDVIVVANKADNPGARRLAETGDWLRLGFDAPMAVSAINGTGVGDLLDEAVARLEAAGKLAQPLPQIDARVAIIGRPNVGKSSLLNALAGEERVIVSEVPYTTKEPQDTLVQYEDPQDRKMKNVLVVDTVGIRKRGRVGQGLEKLGVSMSLKEMERADVALVMVDAERGVDMQEKKLAGMVDDRRVGVVLVVNKWDGEAEKKWGTAQEYEQYIRGQLPAFRWAPIVFISAKTGRGVGTVLRHALNAAAQRNRQLATEALDAFTEKLKKQHHSAFSQGENRPKLYGIVQQDISPPQFILIVRDKDALHTNYLRFVENRLRDEFGFMGTPLRILAREIE